MLKIKLFASFCLHFWLVVALVFITSGTTAFAQNNALVTSGMGGGASSLSRLNAQLTTERNRIDNIEACGNAGRLHGDNFTGNKDGGNCLTDLTVNTSGGTTVTNGLSVSGGASVSGNGTFINNLTINGTTESDGRIFADDGVHVRGDWLRVDGNNGVIFQNHNGGWHMTDTTWLRSLNNKGIFTGGNIRADGQFQINGNVFGPAPVCTTGEKLRWTGTAWECIADLIGEGGASELDPKVGTLIDGRWCWSSGGQVVCDRAAPTANAFDLPPSCTSTQKLRWNNTTTLWECIDDTDSGITAEDDPQVGTLNASKWCLSDGTVINCTTNAPVTIETDPQVATLTTGKWCTTDGSVINCTSDAPSGGGITVEDDPQVGTLTNGRWCRTDGNQVICDRTPPPTCSGSTQKLLWTGSAWQCGTDLQGITSETDPQVGTLTSGKWCTSNGSAVNCASDPPTVTETDPQVGTLTSGMWCTSNGSSVNCTATLPRTPTCTRRTATASSTVASVSCLAGELMLGGGCQESGTKEWRQSYPSADSTWTCRMAESTSITVYANCCAFPAAGACALPWGGTINSGQSVTAWLTEGTCGGTCTSQTRTCNNGTLSGSYTKQSCSTACGGTWVSTGLTGFSCFSDCPTSPPDGTFCPTVGAICEDSFNTGFGCFSSFYECQ